MPERPDDADITAWALAAGHGDRAALAAFVRATQRDVHRFVAHLRSPREADDLAHETYLRALRALPSFTGHSSGRTWLLTIAHHTATDAMRAATRRPRPSPIGDGKPDTHGSVRGATQEALHLRELITALDPERRTAFVLTQVLDLSYAEAAQVCDCPVATIRSRVSHAREDLVAATQDRPGERRRAGGS
jgi:RNA polymerase sigma-70 factor (ECF subfamily)